MKMVRNIRDLSNQEIATIWIALETQQEEYQGNLENARKFNIDQEDFWNERIALCASIIAKVTDADAYLIFEWDGTAAVCGRDHRSRGSGREPNSGRAESGLRRMVRAKR